MAVITNPNQQYTAAQIIHLTDTVPGVNSNIGVYINPVTGLDVKDCICDYSPKYPEKKTAYFVTKLIEAPGCTPQPAIKVAQVIQPDC
jgi:hypothetical protein